MSFGEGGTGGGTSMHMNSADSMAVSGSALETLWLALGGPLLSSFA